ncbi:MAG: NAD(+) synthase [Bacteroidales bacterium]|nr:NAD(+) synthase [Bacteroidales bacterium]
MVLEPSLSIQEVYRVLVTKIQKFFSSAGKNEAVLGLSGGIDSAVVAALAVDALGAEHVHGILMPSAFSTDGSVRDAIDLANNLGISYDIVPIGGIYDSYIEKLGSYFADGKWGVAQENIQARVRGTILMAYSNKFGHLLLNTSNKSELAVGYGTLYGDLSGAVMVLADLYKLQVYELAEYINRGGIRIPVSILTKAPSAELHPGQKDSDSLPVYEELDPVLHALNEGGATNQDLIDRGIDEHLIERIVSLQNGAAFKIMQIPPVLTVCGKPLVPDFKCL